MDDLERAAREKCESRAAVVVRPPESICIAALVELNYISAKEKALKSITWCLFDSHKRTEHDGAAFLEFANRRALGDYLHLLFPRLDLQPESFEEQMQLDLLDTIEASTCASHQ